MKKLFEGQIGHYVSLLILLIVLDKILISFPQALSGELFSYSTELYLLIALIIPIMHQVYVWLCWRLELHFKTLSTILEEKAFPLFKIDFLILFISRPLSILLLSYSNRNTLEISDTLSIVLSVVLMIPVIYLGQSIYLYFGFDRAMGKDHFDVDWARKQDLAKEGIFRFTPNAMYTFGFLLLYVIALLLKSEAGLIMALFNHLYIWCHYYFTERIDMQLIYKKDLSLK